MGVHVLDTHTGQRIRFDDDSRYATASTFKMLLAAAVLKRVDRGEVSLTQRISYSEKDMLKVASPVTTKHLAEGSMSVQDLCAAIVEVSDNVAANLLLKLIGGPPAVTQFARELGDKVTRLDRFEPELNTNLPGDPRDTTSPRAMVGTMKQLFTGSALSSASVNLLNTWMINTMTGLGRIRAGIPKSWKAGDKTGTGANGAVNDLAILWPPGRKPVLIASLPVRVHAEHRGAQRRACRDRGDTLQRAEDRGWLKPSSASQLRGGGGRRHAFLIRGESSRDLGQCVHRLLGGGAVRRDVSAAEVAERLRLKDQRVPPREHVEVVVGEPIRHLRLRDEAHDLPSNRRQRLISEQRPRAVTRAVHDGLLAQLQEVAGLLELARLDSAAGEQEVRHQQSRERADVEDEARVSPDDRVGKRVRPRQHRFPARPEIADARLEVRVLGLAFMASTEPVHSSSGGGSE